MKQIFAGLFTEGTTDERFFLPIIEKMFIQMALEECKGQFDIELIPINIDKTGLSFVEQVIHVSKKGTETYGMMMLCVHTDADSENAKSVYQNKISPLMKELANYDDSHYCKIVVAIVPIYETEAWMLADKELLKSEIGTDISDVKLGIDGKPETITNPKEVIEGAIRISRQNLTQKRRTHLRIADLYLPLGQQMDLDKIAVLSSYQEVKNNIRNAFKMLNLLN